MLRRASWRYGCKPIQGLCVGNSFVKYISDKSRSDEGFDIDIPEGCYFEDFVALKGNPNIGEEMNKKMAALAEANQLDGVFVADFEDDAKLGKGKDKVETLSKLIAVFQNENLDFSKIELPMTIL